MPADSMSYARRVMRKILLTAFLAAMCVACAKTKPEGLVLDDGGCQVVKSIDGQTYLHAQLNRFTANNREGCERFVDKLNDDPFFTGTSARFACNCPGEAPLNSGPLSAAGQPTCGGAFLIVDPGVWQQVGDSSSGSGNAGAVKDLKTGLTWQRFSYSPDVRPGAPVGLTHDRAEVYCASKAMRVPTQDEAITVLEHARSCSRDDVFPHYFHAWTSTSLRSSKKMVLPAEAAGVFGWAVEDGSPFTLPGEPDFVYPAHCVK
jgi:hypothetical protein